MKMPQAPCFLDARVGQSAVLLRMPIAAVTRADDGWLRLQTGFVQADASFG